MGDPRGRRGCARSGRTPAPDDRCRFETLLLARFSGRPAAFSLSGMTSIRFTRQAGSPIITEPFRQRRWTDVPTSTTGCSSLNVEPAGAWPLETTRARCDISDRRHAEASRAFRRAGACRMGRYRRGILQRWVDYRPRARGGGGSGSPLPRAGWRSPISIIPQTIAPTPHRTSTRLARRGSL